MLRDALLQRNRLAPTYPVAHIILPLANVGLDRLFVRHELRQEPRPRLFTNRGLESIGVVSPLAKLWDGPKDVTPILE